MTLVYQKHPNAPPHGESEGPTTAKFQLQDDTQALERIRQLDPVAADTIRSYRNQTDFNWMPFCFYKKHFLLSVEVRLPSKPLLFWYMDDGARLLDLMAAPEPTIYEVNRAESLLLSYEQVPHYLKFFVAFTGIEGQESRVVEKESDIKWLPATKTAETPRRRRAEAAQHLTPVKVEYATGLQGFRATAIVHQGLQLLKAMFTVQYDGEAKFQGAQLVADNLPVPMTL